MRFRCGPWPSRTKLALGASILLIGAGCAAGTSGERDASMAMDGEPEIDAPMMVEVDAGPGTDAGALVDADVGEDGGPPVTSLTCEACEAHGDCQTGSYCVALSVGGRACVPGCNPDIPTCPRSFNCVLDIASGVDSTVCLPVGGTCCVDEDGDGYGQGVGCLGPDCDDDDPEVNPGASERCNGRDDNCDGTVDGPPTDCASGRCTANGDGTYTTVTGADCVDAMCVEGTTSACGLFTCDEGGEVGNRCAMACDPAGVDDDAFCVASAHCEGGECVPDVPNGGMCVQDR